MSYTVVPWSAARMSSKPESEEAAVVDPGLGGRSPVASTG